MSTYNVLFLLHAEDPPALIDRLHDWDLTDDEHVLSIAAVPEPIQIPPGLSAPAGGTDPPPTAGLPDNPQPPVRAPNP
jgi:hypothetical protein